jgi:hypothetical protein
MSRSEDEFGEFLSDISDALAEAVLGEGDAGAAAPVGTPGPTAPAPEAASPPGPIADAWFADREKLALDWVGLEDLLLEDPL